MEYCYRWDGFLLRSARLEDTEAYYTQNFTPLNAEIARLTGCKATFSREEIAAYFQRFVDSENGYLFLLFNPASEIIGESVINEIDWTTRCANFRLALFRTNIFGKGLGTRMTEITRDFAFAILKLHRLELDVFSFNPRARRVYEKAGFRVEGVRKEAVKDGGTYADDILMAILEDEWCALQQSSDLRE